jgi:HSP20 family protein
MALIKWSPLYEPFLDIERAFDDMRSFAPAIDLYDKGDDLIAEVALAGINPEHVKLHIEDSVLNIEGSMEKKTEVDETNYYRKEVRSGAFHRVISLPTSVNGPMAKAEYEKGILKITMPKKEEIKATPITIQIKK